MILLQVNECLRVYYTLTAGRYLQSVIVLDGICDCTKRLPFACEFKSYLLVLN